MNQKTFLYQINVTRDCNIRCSHCYISSEKKAVSKQMSQEQVLKIINDIVEHMRIDSMESKIYDTVEIHIIGGEPTMLGFQYYKDLIPKIKEKLSIIKQQVSLKIVTNLLSRDTIKIIKLFDEVATSYEIDTRFTKLKLKEKWEARVLEIFESTDIKFSVTSCITRAAIVHGPEEIAEYLLNLGFLNMHFGFFIPSGDGLVNKLLVAPEHEETSKFLIELTKWYMQKKRHNNKLFINPIESMYRSIKYCTPSDDIVCPIIPGSLDFDSDGNTVTCIEKGGDMDVDWIGNVFSSSITELLNTPKYMKERLKSVRPKIVCTTCDHFAVCQGACDVLHNQWNGIGECPGFSNWITYMQSIVDDNIRLTA